MEEEAHTIVHANDGKGLHAKTSLHGRWALLLGGALNALPESTNWASCYGHSVSSDFRKKGWQPFLVGLEGSRCVCR